MHHSTDRIVHTAAFDSPVVEQWLKNKRNIHTWIAVFNFSGSGGGNNISSSSIVVTAVVVVVDDVGVNVSKS